MAFQPVPNVCECRLVYTQTGNDSPIVNVFHFRNVAGIPYGAAGVLAVANSVNANWTAWLDDHISIGMTLTEIKVTDLNSEAAASATLAPAKVGLLASTILPVSSPGIIKFLCSTGLPRQGRLFHSSVAEGNVDNAGRWSTVPADTVLAAYAGFFANVDAASSNHCVVSRYHNSEKRVAGVANDVSSYAVRYIIGSQRDRRPSL